MNMDALTDQLVDALESVAGQPYGLFLSGVVAFIDAEGSICAKNVKTGEPFAILENPAFLAAMLEKMEFDSVI